MLQTLLLAAAISTTPIPIDQAKHAFDEARLASEEDGGKLWGVPLYGPILFVDPQTRFAVANVADAGGKLTPQDGVFIGTLDNSVGVANTAKTWSGTRWTMVAWNFVASRSVPRRRLIMHECFHRVQESIGFAAADAINPHLDILDGRYWLLLEFRALAAALKTTGDARKQAIADAIAFRARRRSLFPGGAEKERALENNEGLAEYTGWALRGTTDSESRSTLAQSLLNIDPSTTFARAFAYQTGPAYGLLLDAIAAGWTRRYHASDDLAAFTGLRPADDADEAAKRYGGPDLRAAEAKRDAELREKIAKYRALLVEGPVIELPMIAANYGFDPNSIVTLPEGTVYPTFEVTAAWGTLKTAAGALMAADYSRIFVPASVKGVLKLATGWKIVPGSRLGDYRVTR